MSFVTCPCGRVMCRRRAVYAHTDTHAAPDGDAREVCRDRDRGPLALRVGLHPAHDPAAALRDCVRGPRVCATRPLSVSQGFFLFTPHWHTSDIGTALGFTIYLLPTHHFV